MDLRILLINTKLGNLNGYLTMFVREGLAAVVGDEQVVVSDYHTCQHDYERHGCNAVLCFDGQEINRHIIGRLRRMCPRMALWLTEDPYELPRNRLNLDLFDAVFTNDRGSVARYETPRVRHLPLAASPSVHARPVIEDESEYLYDVFFAGVAWPNRVALLKRLTAALRGRRVKLLLPHNEFLSPPDVDLPGFEINYRLSNLDLARVQNRSRIVLYLHRDFSAGGEPQKSSTPGPRLFETALAGAFQLAEDALPEIDEYFARDREIAYFRSVDDCLDRIRHFLDHPDERRAIAEAARRRAQREHLYSHRAERIVTALRAMTPREVRIHENGRTANVLYVLHNVAGKPPFGGAELHTKVTLESLSNRYRGLLYYPDMATPGARRMVLRRGDVEKPTLLERPLDAGAYHDDERERHFARILERERVDLVHFMHLLQHPPSLIEVARRHGAKTVLTLHDYFVVCPRFNLLDGSGRFCWNAPPPLATCDIDLKRTDGLRPGSQASRRAAFGHWLSMTDVVTCVSESQWEIVRSAYPHIEDKVRIIPPGIDTAAFQRLPREARAPGRPLVVAALGNFTQAKGADTLTYVFDYFRDDERLRFVVVGRLDEPYASIFKTINLDRVRIIGTYDPAELPAILGDVDVALLVSIWPETYVLTLSECWAAGVIPIVSDIGALRERATDGVNALKTPPDSPGHVVEALERLLTEPGLLERLRADACSSPIQTIAAATAEYERIYDGLLSARPASGTPENGSSYEDGAPIPTAGRRLHAGWARRPVESVNGHSELQDGQASLPRKIIRYYRKHGMARTSRRLVLRLLGRP